MKNKMFSIAIAALIFFVAYHAAFWVLHVTDSIFAYIGTVIVLGFSAVEVLTFGWQNPDTP
jgi:hypothetical protein